VKPPAASAERMSRETAPPKFVKSAPGKHGKKKGRPYNSHPFSGYARIGIAALKYRVEEFIALQWIAF